MDAWWRTATIYQVYIRSFRDASGDGIGDVEGIRQGLPYLRDLGVDALWITPWYPSPMADAGYDVADYRSIEPLFGSLEEGERLIGEAHEHGLRVILDIVPNHTSDRHVWFQSALAAAPGSPERARYIFRPGRGPDGDQPPNDWRSVFGGRAWTRVTEPDGSPGEWYLHLFAPEQPDLDWRHPEVRAEFEDVLRHWFDRGVDGFRIDVAHGLIKDPALPDLGIPDGQVLGAPVMEANHPHWDRDEVHEIYRGWRAIADSYDSPRVFVAEAWVPDGERLARYLRPDELHTAFNFDHLRAPWLAGELREVIDTSIESMATVDAPPTWVLANHDVTREVSRFGRPQAPGPRHALVDVQAAGPLDLELGVRRARAAALLMLALPGGAYVYQGEELGLEEVEDLAPEVRQDPTFERTNRADPGRDGCRVPIPWGGGAAPFGFSPEGTAAAPWLPQPAHWADLSVEAQTGDPASMLELYRSALHLRREHLAADRPLEWVEASDAVLAFRRGAMTCVVNFGPEDRELPDDAEVLLRSDTPAPREAGRLAPDAAAWLLH